MQATTGNIDEDIDAAVIRDDFLKSSLHIGLPGNIQGDETCLFSPCLDFGGNLFPAIFIYIQDYYNMILPGQMFRHRLANSRCSTGYHGNLVHKPFLSGSLDCCFYEPYLKSETSVKARA